MNESGAIHNFGPFQLDIEQQVLLRDGRAVEIKPKEFQLLVVLLENSGRVVSKEDLIQQVWPDAFVEDGNLTVSIFKLRKTLDEGRNGESYIQTVPRRGYRFVAVLEDESKADLGVEEASEARMRSAESQAPPKRSIAVLPFKPIGAKTDEYLGLGMADALITRLSNLRQITVRPTSSVRKYVGLDDPISAGLELRVDWVLDGSVQKSGRRMRVTLQLIGVDDSSVHWAERFDVDFTDIFAVEDSISEQLASAIEPRITSEERRLLIKRDTDNTDAHLAYLKGRYFFEKRTSSSCRKGIQYFQEAIKYDRNYALAYVGLAGCYIALGSYTVLPWRDSNDKAERAVLNALHIDPGLCEAHGFLAHLRTRRWDWSGANEEFKRALLLNPDSAIVHCWHAVFLCETGFFERSLSEIDLAVRLDPLSLIIKGTRASILYMMRQYDDVITQCQEIQDLDASFDLAHSFLAFAYEAKGDYPQAISEYQRALGGFGNVPELIACLGRTNALSGNTIKALQAIEKLTTWPDSKQVQAYSIALIYSALGNIDEALRWLERSYVEAEEDLSVLKVDPRLDNLRGHPRFTDIIRGVGLDDLGIDAPTSK